MANHGIHVTQAATAVSTPNTASVGIPFVVGPAPLATATGTAATIGKPVLCTSYSEAVEQLGWSDDWSAYPVCEVIYAHFKLFSCQPLIVTAVGTEDSDTHEYTATPAQVAAGFESVELCMSMFGIVPDILLAPGFSDQSTVSSVMATKAPAINGMFRAKALVDIAAASYTAAVTAKNNGSYDENEVVCWPYVKIGTMKFHMSTMVAGRMAATDVDNGGIPYESPSNKSIAGDGLCLADGTAVLLTHAQANTLNNAGIVTALNFMGSFVVWGNYTGCYPASSDVKDYFIPVNRMFDFVNNTLIKTFWSKLDGPMNRRLIDTVLDSCNIWLNGLVGGGYLLGARCEMIESENPLSNLMAGIIKLHVYITPPSPMQELDFTLEYDASYVETALQG